jgi:hypothetical protein
LQELLDQVYQSTKSSIQIIQSKVRAYVSSLDTKLGQICKNFDLSNVSRDTMAKYEKIIAEVDTYIHTNQMNLLELENLLQKYAESLKKVQDLNPSLPVAKRRRATTTATKKEHVVRCERTIHYHVHEDFVPFDNLKGGD